MIRNILLSTIPGLIIAGATFYVFTSAPKSPVEGISIKMREQMVPTQLFLRIAGTVQTKDFKPAEVIEKFYDFFDGKANTTIVTYDIENDTSKELKNLTVEFKSIISAQVEDDDGSRSSTAETKTMPIRLLPGNKGQVSVLYTGSRHSNVERFLIDSQAVPVKALDEPLYQDPLAKWMTEHSDLAFILWSASFLVIGGTVLALVLSAFFRHRPDLWAQAVDSGKLVQALTAINLLKMENPKKFDSIVARSEKMYKRWAEKLDPTLPGGGDT